MSETQHIERYGNLLKQESLRTLEDKIWPNTFVLEAPEPFPGFFNYYSDHPVDSKPLYIYLVLKRLYTLEEITRATQNIQKYFDTDFNATPGVVNIYNKQFDVIRVRHLDNFSQITDLQASYMDQGIEFKSKPNRKVEGPAVIRIKKFFILDEPEQGLFFDTIEKDHGYFLIPNQLTWKHFEDITRRVKFNWEKPFFDAAIGHFHVKFGLQDMIRIYYPEMSLDYLREVRKKYLERIK
ncbi:hypothetical protein [Marinilabilia salmonicolor]|jgi:hypothetical protein|uniref:Uncharacterized protein n=1 Tax=Marinilabilia salmonicolor TaxID=989 RepID=A0A2T0XNB9_9BACT|nr:hypothetical protein [Marinilabilia salmonicolor]PRZ00372.1 hypothetical protein BY457_106198 [Marinilabilia salmonicolor]RCW34549.1 hypothetical protein DFO77_11150 [Marinilabilia salmonicolor]